MPAKKREEAREQVCKTECEGVRDEDGALAEYRREQKAVGQRTRELRDLHCVNEA